MKAIAHNSKNTTTPAMAVAIQNALAQLVGHEIGHGVTEPAERRHRAAGDAAQPGRAASRERAVVGQCFRKAHADAGADRCGEAHQECLPVLVRGEGRREQRRQCRDRSVHQAGEARLHILQHEHAPAGPVFLGAHV